MTSSKGRSVLKVLAPVPIVPGRTEGAMTVVAMWFFALALSES